MLTSCEFGVWICFLICKVLYSPFFKWQWSQDRYVDQVTQNDLQTMRSTTCTWVPLLGLLFGRSCVTQLPPGWRDRHPSRRGGRLFSVWVTGVPCMSCRHKLLIWPDRVIFQQDSSWMPFHGLCPSGKLATASHSSFLTEPAFPYWKKMKCTFQNVSFSCRTLSPMVE